MTTKRRCVFAVIALAAALPTDAADSGAQDAGFGGQLSVGTLFAAAKTNMVSSAGAGLLQLGQVSPDSLNGGPRDHTGVYPIVALRLTYTVANTGTQLFFGGSPGDALQFDYDLAGGVRQPIGRAGTVSFAYLYGLPVKVWADPYVTGVARTETTRNSQGARLGWDGILGSALRLQYMFRAITVDTERSGTFLRLSAGESGLLDRAGNAHQVEIRYPFTIARAHRFTPALSYTFEDLHGAAMRAQAYDLKLRYALGARRFAVVLDGSIGRSEHDQRNPIFDRTQADLRYSASATVLYRTPFGWEPFGYRRWSLFATVRYSAVESNIAFYSAGLFGSGIGLSTEF